MKIMICWEWGLQEVKEFSDKESMNNFLKKNDGCIDLWVDWTDLSIKNDNTYCPMRTMSDYEMDVLL